MAVPLRFSVDPKDYINANGTVNLEVFAGPVTYVGYQLGIEKLDYYDKLWPTSQVSLESGLAKDWRLVLVNDPRLAEQLIRRYFPDVSYSDQIHLAFFDSPEFLLKGLVVYALQPRPGEKPPYSEISGRGLEVSVLRLGYDAQSDLGIPGRLKLIQGLAACFGVLPDTSPAFIHLLDADFDASLTAATDDDFENLWAKIFTLVGALAANQLEFPSVAEIAPGFKSNLTTYFETLKKVVDVDLLIQVFGPLPVLFKHTKIVFKEWVAELLGDNNQTAWNKFIDTLIAGEFNDGLGRIKMILRLMGHLQYAYHQFVALLSPPPGLQILPADTYRIHIVGEQVSADLITLLPHSQSLNALLRMGVAAEELREIAGIYRRGGMTGNIFDVSRSNAAVVIDQLLRKDKVDLARHVEKTLSDFHHEVRGILTVK